MKKISIIVLSAILLSLTAACGNNAELEALKKENKELKQQLNNSFVDKTTPNTSSISKSSRELKEISIGETVLVQTKYGDFEISIDKVHKTDIYDDSPETLAATIQCVVNNISYSSDLHPDTINGYDIAEQHDYVQLADRNGIAFPFYDISGPTDGSYAVSHELPIGSKSRESYPFLVPSETADVSIIINNQYILNTIISE